VGVGTEEASERIGEKTPVLTDGLRSVERRIEEVSTSR